MRCSLAVDPDSPTMQSRHVGGCCVVNGRENIGVVVTRISGSESSK
jgi:hypothetical protein